MRPRLSILWRSHCRAGAAASRHASAACFAKSCPCMTACITALVCLPLLPSLSSAHAGRHPARTAYLLFQPCASTCSPWCAARAAFSAFSSVCMAFFPTSRPFSCASRLACLQILVADSRCATCAAPFSLPHSPRVAAHSPVSQCWSVGLQLLASAFSLIHSILARLFRSAMPPRVAGGLIRRRFLSRSSLHARHPIFSLLVAGPPSLPSALSLLLCVRPPWILHTCPTLIPSTTPRLVLYSATASGVICPCVACEISWRRCCVAYAHGSNTVDVDCHEALSGCGSIMRGLALLHACWLCVRASCSRSFARVTQARVEGKARECMSASSFLCVLSACPPPAP